MDLEYFNKITLKVEGQQQTLSYYENIKKNTELFDRKETIYRQSPVKLIDTPAEIAYLNNKKLHYKTRIQEMEENLEKNSKNIHETSKKLENLEKEHKVLMDDVGEPYFRELSRKKLMKTVKEKQKIEQLIVKETNSKVTTMQQKIKTLQIELKSLKDNESEMYSKIIDVSKQADVYSQKIRKSPIFMNKNNLFDIRSRSVKPQFHEYYIKKFLTN
jgi:chromosome segregation ATPase